MLTNKIVRAMLSVKKQKRGNPVFRISEKASTVLSLIFTGVALVLLVVLTCMLPSIIGWYLEITARPGLDRTAVTALLYAALVPAYTAAFALLSLLRKVQREAIFTDKAVGNLRLVSYCCLAECAVFAVLTVYFQFAAFIAFASLFMCVILRVVKNVIAKAAEVKAENDFTI